MVHNVLNTISEIQANVPRDSAQWQRTRLLKKQVKTLLQRVAALEKENSALKKQADRQNIKPNSKPDPAVSQVHFEGVDGVFIRRQP